MKRKKAEGSWRRELSTFKRLYNKAEKCPLLYKGRIPLGLSGEHIARLVETSLM